MFEPKSGKQQRSTRRALQNATDIAFGPDKALVCKNEASSQHIQPSSITLANFNMSSSPILLITGGNAGLGFQTVKALSNSSVGYTILLGGRNLQKAAAAAEGLKNVTPIQIDIEKDESIKAAFKHVSEKYGRLDILINNAGSSHSTVFRAFLTRNRRSIRPRHQPVNARNVEQILERQHHIHANHDTHLPTSPPQVL